MIILGQGSPGDERTMRTVLMYQGREDPVQRVGLLLKRRRGWVFPRVMFEENIEEHLST